MAVPAGHRPSHLLLDKDFLGWICQGFFLPKVSQEEGGGGELKLCSADSAGGKTPFWERKSGHRKGALFGQDLASWFQSTPLVGCQLKNNHGEHLIFNGLKTDYHFLLLWTLPMAELL